MSRLLWSDDYSVHIRSIDNEHKLLIEMLNDMDRAMQTAPLVRRQLVTEALVQLLRHTRAHFESEERFLLLNKYGEIAAHQEEHRELLLKLDDFSQRFISGTEEFNDGDLLFLKDWMVRHIILHDCKYGSQFSGRTDLVPHSA